jgi:hypothetical protein
MRDCVKGRQRFASQSAAATEGPPASYTAEMHSDPKGRDRGAAQAGLWDRWYRSKPRAIAVKEPCARAIINMLRPGTDYILYCIKCWHCGHIPGFRAYLEPKACVRRGKSQDTRRQKMDVNAFVADRFGQLIQAF